MNDEVRDLSAAEERMQPPVANLSRVEPCPCSGDYASERGAFALNDSFAVLHIQDV